MTTIDETTEPLEELREVDATYGSVNTDEGTSVDLREDAASGSSSTTDEAIEEEPGEPESFPREYVQKLRDESAKYRQRAQQTDALAQRLHVALVAATGRLADPDDLPYSEAHLDDPEALTEALDALVERKPHLASRRPYGDVGQGVTTSTDSVDLAGLLRLGAN